MASLAIDHFGEPASERGRRALDSARRRAREALGERTIWLSTALPESRASAERLRALLQEAGARPEAAGWIVVDPDQPVAQTAEGLEAGGDAIIGHDVAADDIVVLHDPVTALLSEAVRERGAHVVWHVSVGAVPASDAWAFMRDYTSAVDAYVLTWARQVSPGMVVWSAAAVMPSAGIVAAKEIELRAPGSPDRELGWSTLLGDVVRDDRSECVGGRLHARPTVAPR